MINKTYIINLQRCQNKRKNMENEFAKLKEMGTDLDHEFFEAIDGNNTEMLSTFNFHVPNWYDPSSGKATTNGEIGCALSHYLIWQHIVMSVENKSLPDDCKILILEDDVVFLDNFMEKFKMYTNEINVPYDMLYLHRKPLNLQAETKLSAHVNIIQKSYWACAYVLTYSGAKKLYNANYLNNLIPVDEFLPIMYGCNVLGFEKLYESCEKINCYAITPSLLRLTDNAFQVSETFHSEPHSENTTFTFTDSNGNNKNFTAIYLGPTKGHGYQRFLHYCKLYGIPLIIINNNNDSSQIQLLKNELNSWSIDKLASTLIMVFSVNSDDYCNIIPVASPAEITSKFLNLSGSVDNIVVPENGTQNSKLIFFTWASRIVQLIEQFSEKMSNSSNGIDTPLSILITINSLISKNTIYDNRCEIFHCISATNTSFNHKSSRVINSQTNMVPCIIYANNDDNSVIRINQAENYTGNNWNEYYGYRISARSNLTLPKIYLSFNLGNNKNILQIIDNLDYPKDLLTVYINQIGFEQHENEYVNENELHRQDISRYLNSDCDYYCFVDKDCVLDNPNVLKELLNLNKKCVAPLMRRGTELWTNFWGDLTDKGFYKRSFDYIDIIDNKKQGCWNVPYITGTYFIAREVIESVPNLFTDKLELDIDMRMCFNLRMKNIFMYVSNICSYGYLDNYVEQPLLIFKSASEQPQAQPIKLVGEPTLYDLFNQREEWEKKYLHSEYLQNINNLSNLRCTELCGDAFNFPIFSPVFCKEMISLMEANGEWSKGNNEHSDPRLGKNYYENVPTQDIHLFQIGLDKHWENIVMTYIAPMARVLFSNYKTKGVHLAFVVRYHWQQQSELSAHHDASTYTINVALNQSGTDFEGGGCYFLRQKYTVTNQEVGSANIHPGRLTHYHQGLKTTAGIRYILVSFIN